MTPIIGNAHARVYHPIARSYKEATQGRHLTREDFEDYVERDLTWGKVLAAALVILAVCYLGVVL